MPAATTQDTPTIDLGQLTPDTEEGRLPTGKGVRVEKISDGKDTVFEVLTEGAATVKIPNIAPGIKVKIFAGLETDCVGNNSTVEILGGGAKIKKIDERACVIVDRTESGKASEGAVVLEIGSMGKHVRAGNCLGEVKVTSDIDEGGVLAGHKLSYDAQKVAESARFPLKTSVSTDPAKIRAFVESRGTRGQSDVAMARS